MNHLAVNKKTLSLAGIESQYQPQSSVDTYQTLSSWKLCKYYTAFETMQLDHLSRSNVLLSLLIKCDQQITWKSQLWHELFINKLQKQKINGCKKDKDNRTTFMFILICLTLKKVLIRPQADLLLVFWYTIVRFRWFG